MSNTKNPRLPTIPTTRTILAFGVERQTSIQRPKKKFIIVSPVMIIIVEGLFQKKKIRLRTRRMIGRNCFSAIRKNITAVGKKKNKNTNDVKSIQKNPTAINRM